MMQYSAAIRYALVLSLVVLALAGQSTAQACTPETCPPGPVLAYFQYSNCTGEVTYISYLPPGEQWNLCVNSSGYSIVYALTDEYLGQMTFLGSDDCGKIDKPSYVFGNLYYLGVCQPTAVKRSEQNFVSLLGNLDSTLGFQHLGGFGFDHASSLYSREVSAGALSLVYLPHVNATVERQDPIIVGEEVPPFAGVEEACYSADNCTFNGQPPFYSITASTNETCVEQTGSSMLANVTDGQCYLAGSSEVAVQRYRCLDEHTIAVEYATGDCRRTIQSTVIGADCGPGQIQTLTCTPKSSPLSIPPLSSAPPSSISFIMVAFVILATMTLILSF